jgi:hypothetical protein
MAYKLKRSNWQKEEKEEEKEEGHHHLQWNEIDEKKRKKMVIKFLSIHYAKIVVILTIILKWIFATFRTVRVKFCTGFFFFLFTSDPFFSFLGHNKHSILYSHKFERCSNGNSILKFRHLYIRYNMHMHESRRLDVSSGSCEKRTFALVISYY